MKRHCSIFLACATTLAASVAHAGAWVQPQGKGLFIAQAGIYHNSEYFDADGARQAQDDFYKLELQPYVEYGVSDAVTLGASAFLQTVAQSGESNYGIADPELFARARIYSNDTHVISLQPLVKFSSRFANNAPPRGGSKSTDIEVSALYGQNLDLYSNRDYLDLRAGYRLRDRGLSDQLKFDAALGLSITPEIQLIPALRATIATDLTRAATFTESGDIDSTLIKAELGGIYHLNDRQWLQASLFTHAYGQQTGNGFGASVGFAQRF